MKKESFAYTALAAIVLCLASMPAAIAEAPAADDVFASVGETTISRAEFEREVYAAARQTFYHGSPETAEEYIEFRKEVADKLIVRHLLLEEAERRKIEPDSAAIDARIAQYELRYGDTERWQTDGPAMAAALRQRFEQDSVVERLEEQVRRIDLPDIATVRVFYDENQELFTQPASNRVAVILLGVEPSAGPAGWQAAREEARRVREELAAGADFAELAALHSSDTTAQAGGDMGYQHEGALSPGAEAAIAELDIGDVSEPIRVLEGMVIFKLLDRRPRQLQGFEDVQDRAEALWLRHEADARWQEFVAVLREETDIQIDTDYLAYVPGDDH
jgi:parvulin-like peptidyl-prolyl isomerase